MSITGKQTINIGLPNESANSDPIRTALTKTQTNFDNLFANASPFNTFTPNTGIGITSNATTGTVTVTNTGVTNIIAGTNIVIDSANGNVTISSSGGNGNGGGTVTSVAVAAASGSRMSVSGSPIVANGTITVDLAVSGAVAGSYTSPNVTVDSYGRITNIANGANSGTVTSVGITAGQGVQVNGGPITSTGNITVTNTGVVRLNAGSGIAVSSANGNVTISSTSTSGTVTSVAVSSSQLLVTGSPIVSFGTIGINLPNNVTFSGNGSFGGNLAVTGTLGVTSTVQAQGAFIRTANTTATPAGGAANTGFLMGSDSIGIFFGSGAPTLSAAQGSLYLRSDGTTTNDRMYVNTNGTTGWTAVITAT